MTYFFFQRSFKKSSETMNINFKLASDVSSKFIGLFLRLGQQCLLFLFSYRIKYYLHLYRGLFTRVDTSLCCILCWSVSVQGASVFSNICYLLSSVVNTPEIFCKQPISRHHHLSAIIQLSVGDGSSPWDRHNGGFITMTLEK